MRSGRRKFLSTAVLSGAALALAPAVRVAAAAGSAGEQLYDQSIAIDGLGGPLQTGEPLSVAALADVRASGLTAAHLTVGEVGSMAPLLAFEKIVRSITAWEAEIDRHPKVLMRVRSADDIRQAKLQGRTGLIYGLQDGVAFEDDLDRLSALHQLGIRVIQPTYNRRNLIGDGVMEPADAGLSRTGMDVIERLNQLGILLDLSHCGRRTSADAIAASKRPVAFTHTGCAALADHPRHRTDAELRAVADTGGLVGIFIMPYLAEGRQPSAKEVIAHLEHALKVAGADHVSIGTDGDLAPTELTPEFIERFRENTRARKAQGIAAPLETEEGYLFARDLNTPRRFALLAQGLLDRGHDASTVSKVLGGNLLRVFGEAWRTPGRS